MFYQVTDNIYGVNNVKCYGVTLSGITIANCGSGSQDKKMAQQICDALNDMSIVVAALRDTTDIINRRIEGNEGRDDIAHIWDNARDVLTKYEVK